MSVLLASGYQPSRAQTSSAGNSPQPAILASLGSSQQSAVSRPDLRSEISNLRPEPTPTPAATPDGDAGLRAACNDTLNELLKARILIKDQDDQIERYQKLTELYDDISADLKKLRTMDAEEKQHLRDAVAAANKEIGALRAENSHLKKNQVTVWKKVKWIGLGAGVGIIVCAIFCGK